MRIPLVIASLLLALPGTAEEYPWLDRAPTGDSLRSRFAPPTGFTRVDAAKGSYAAWLRELPLAPPGTPVRDYEGDVVDGAPAAAVVDLDVGARDLQQCADSVIRLRAEYLFARKRSDDIAFHFTSGDLSRFSQWAKGVRPVVSGSTVRWAKKGRPDASHKALRRYLSNTFIWAGTLSLERYTARVATKDVRAGDFLVLGGSPGHALVILDVARASDGRRVALIGQGFMPAQSLHVVEHASGAAWHPLDDPGGVRVASWPAPFPLSSTRRFTEHPRR